MKSKLKEKIFGGIYEYFRTDNDEVVYRGSAKLTPSRKKDTLFESADDFHRKGETFNYKYKYSWTVFRSNLRRPLGEKLEMRVIVEPKEMTLEELLTLEGEWIRKGIDAGQCYLNHDPDPLKTWKRYNS
tara:strand:- start:196 stop:582 length:387 start_codon:yes stop_codon:yes gene_type:complete